MIENYVHRRRVRSDEHVATKSIVDPRRALASLGPHTFLYSEGHVVDEDMRPVDQLDGRGLKPVSWARFRIHHYWSKSEEELERKAQQWRSLGSGRGMRGGGPPGERDETLAAYGPAVRSALEPPGDHEDAGRHRHGLCRSGCTRDERAGPGRADVWLHRHGRPRGDRL